ncbi:MAG: translational GTPase TypA [Gammaproteobacteria bacterium]|nr:translational GTPase TypA [Gammaproteobacteria bacterium]NIN60990.1 translational GTPase TypA [Gammaproteobacteria bacterium]NIO62614.1 translational GTPase TypA [Gammaproteobacteria bacterium]NIP49469.1 translational GTPase TypA [Gammaproteobacteria bacterium]NIQ10693.1 translational GTPase TypA [Gammaproteobacteria bacterium]
MIENIRNIAIIAHVDHGKTTLVDELLKQSGTLKSRNLEQERVMDNNELERERGITILAKNTALQWNNYRINIIDTPGHADFGGEVERVLSMADSVLLLVDAVDGPMPQTRFVTEKALARGFRPIVVINKVDRPGARPHWVLDRTFDLFDRLGANDKQLDFPVVYTSAINGYSSLDSGAREGDMQVLFQIIIDHVPPPNVDPGAPFQMQISSLAYNSYVGVIGIGRVSRGSIKTNTPVTVVNVKGEQRPGRVLQIYKLLGLERMEIPEASAGDIIAMCGIEDLGISETLCSPRHIEPLPPLSIDEPTVSMTFQVNDSPFSGKEGKYVTSRQIKERLLQELKHNVALRVEETDDPDRFKVSGRGELHLSILIETMRREGYELGVSRPEVIMKRVNGEIQEPYEQLTVDMDSNYQGAVMELLGQRGGELKEMLPDGKGRVRLDYIIPARGLIGFRTLYLTTTSGTGLLYHVFDHYGSVKRTDADGRVNGVLIANGSGKALGYALFNLQDRGQMLIEPRVEVYGGMIVGIHSRDNDLVVNVLKAKQLTNIRAAGRDDNILLTPPLKFSLEQALEFIENDELVEITPKNIRLRKKLLKEHERKSASRVKAG